jgi:uncharacterized membrane protein YuzA (DUF378 family)
MACCKAFKDLVLLSANGVNARTIYLIIGIEILYMISPFALYYYSTYGPSLNFLHQSSLTSWLTGFFLPHYVKTSSFILNYYPLFGWILIFAGLTFFLIGAGQIYCDRTFNFNCVASPQKHLPIYRHRSFE